MHKLDKLAYEMDYEGRSASRGLVLGGIVAVAVVAGIVAFCCSGCSTLRSIVENPTVQDMAMDQLDRLADKWIAKLEKLPPVEVPPVVTPEPGKPVPPVAAAGDQLPFSSLTWFHNNAGFPGGFDGRKAVFDRVTISGMNFNGKSLTFKWDTTLTPWGIPDKQAGAIVCVFFERDGQWVGGKFDWISAPDRASRGLEHCDSGKYSNWPAVGIKLPFRGRIAFGVFSADGKRRSNILVAGAN